MAAIEMYRRRDLLPDRNEAILKLIRIGLDRVKVAIPMKIATAEPAGQNADTGREAAKWGSTTGPDIGAQLGFTRISNAGSEFKDAKDQRLSIRCARQTNNQIGLLNDMRDRIDYVIGAFEAADGGFDLYKISVGLWSKYARPGSPGSKVGAKLTLLTRGRLEQYGEPMGHIHLHTTSASSAERPAPAPPSTTPSIPNEDHVSINRLRRWASNPKLRVHSIIAIMSHHKSLSRREFVAKILELGISRAPYGAVASLMSNEGNSYGRVFVEDAAGTLSFHPGIVHEIGKHQWMLKGSASS